LKKRFFALILTVIISITGCSNKSEWGVAPTEAHVPNVSIPRVRIGVPYIISGKTYIPLEFNGNMQEIKGELPVVTHYTIDVSKLQGDGWNMDYFTVRNKFIVEVEFDEIPQSVTYMLFDENWNTIYAEETFTAPSEPGDYVLVINIDNDSEVYLIRLFHGGHREECRYIDFYHGGGEGIILHEGFHELLDLYALLEQDDETIEEYLSTLCKREYASRECPCYLQTRVDIQNLFSWLRLDELRLPLSDSVPLREMLIRDRYADIYMRYEIGDMLYNFSLSPASFWNVDESIEEGWHGNEDFQWFTERVITIGDVNIYNNYYPIFPELVFNLSINGRYISCDVSIPCANPETCERGEPIPSSSEHYCRGEQVDRQAAIDGLMQFEFRTLF